MRHTMLQLLERQASTVSTSASTSSDHISAVGRVIMMLHVTRGPRNSCQADDRTEMKTSEI